MEKKYDAVVRVGVWTTGESIEEARQYVESSIATVCRHFDGPNRPTYPSIDVDSIEFIEIEEIHATEEKR